MIREIINALPVVVLGVTWALIVALMLLHIMQGKTEL